MKPKPLSNETLSKIVAIALGRGALMPTKHLRERMQERNFDMNDVIAVFERHDRIKPVWNDNAGCWNYDVRGCDVDGAELTIRIVPTDDEKGVVLVTGF